jgi:hypothetical protein
LPLGLAPGRSGTDFVDHAHVPGVLPGRFKSLGNPSRFSLGFSLDFPWDFPGISGPGFDRIDGTGALQGSHSGTCESPGSLLRRIAEAG